MSLSFPDISYHTAPMPVVFHQGRIWRAMEDEKGRRKVGTNVPSLHAFGTGKRRSLEGFQLDRIECLAV